MPLLTKDMLSAYSKKDWILDLIGSEPRADDALFAAQRWLRESLPKRCIYAFLYGDLLAPSAARRSVLDVGGGFSSLSSRLARSHDYDVLEIAAHDEGSCLASLEKEAGRKFIHLGDWHQFNPSRYDIVIANDLFPNVDQRLALFLEKFLPVSKTIRLALTFYNQPRFYAARRLDADEVLTLLAYDGRHTALVLEPYRDLIGEAALPALLSSKESVYPNGRQVLLLTLSGKAA